MDEYSNYLAILKWSIAQNDNISSEPPKPMDQDVYLVNILEKAIFRKSN